MRIKGQNQILLLHNVYTVMMCATALELKIDHYSQWNYIFCLTSVTVIWWCNLAYHCTELTVLHGQITARNRCDEPHGWNVNIAGLKQSSDVHMTRDATDK